MLPVVIIGENLQRMQHIGKSMPMAQCVPLRSIRFNQQQDTQHIPALGAPSIVLLDIEAHNSEQVGSYIKRFKMAYPSSAVLVLIGFGDAKAEQIVIDSGADDVLLRPVSLMRLTLTVRNLSELVNRRNASEEPYSGSGAMMRSHSDSVSLLNADGTLKRLHKMEQDIISFAVEYCHGHISNTAKALGIGRSTLYRKLDAFQTRTKFEERVLNKHDRVIPMEPVDTVY